MVLQTRPSQGKNVTLFDRARAEMKRRADLLPQEVQDWESNAQANIAALGIHGSQFNALKIMMDGLLQRQSDLLDQLSPALPLNQFADIYSRLGFEIAGTHELWRIFRYIFSQFHDKRVDAADLVAADCYLTCMNRVRDWGLITEEQFRAPPLVYLEAEISPATASRGAMIGALSFPLRRYRSLRLPIPIVILPFDQAECVWLFCTLHHEVGHNVDQDLDLQQELRQRLDERLETQQTTSERREMWERWTGEILADAFGVLLGGAGFAHTLTSLLLMLAASSASSGQNLNSNDEHPHPYVRLPLISALLRRCGVPALNDAADLIEQTWEAYPRPDWITPYVTESDLVAEIFLTQPLVALGNRALHELSSNLADDTERAANLANFLRTGYLRPPPNLPTRFPWRLVPVAAQLAFMQLENPNAATLDSIQQRSLKYLRDIERPQWLAGVDQRAFLRQLVDDIEFRPAPAQPGQLTQQP
jgi:hypothetical protein